MSRRLQTMLALSLTAALGVGILFASCSKETDALPPNGPFSASATLSTNTMHVGDPLRLTLKVTHPSGSQILVPDIAQGKDLVIRNQQTKTEQLTPEDTRTETVYDLTSLVVGQHVVSSNMIKCITAEGDTFSEPFPFQSFEVVTLLDSPDVQMRAIKDIAKWPGVFPRWLLALLLIALLAAIAALIVRHVLTKRRTILHCAPPTPPYEVALRELRALRSKGWIEELNVEPFYVELSGIVRRYLEKRFNLRAPERTTEEFIREAANSRILNTAQQYTVRDFLEQSDLVKFARHHPQKEDMEAAYSAAEHLVIETTPKPEPREEEVSQP